MFVWHGIEDFIIFLFPEGGRRDDVTSKNPFHRAKKHIKTLISKGN